MTGVLLLAKCLNKLHGFLPKELTERLYRLQGFTTMVATCLELEEFVEVVNKNEGNGNNILFEAVLEKMGLKIISISLSNRLSSFVAALEDFAHHFPDERNLEIINLCKSQETLQSALEEEMQGTLFAEAKDAVIVTALANLIGVVIVVIPSVSGLAMYPVIPRTIRFAADPIFFACYPNQKCLVPILKTTLKVSYLIDFFSYQ